MRMSNGKHIICASFIILIVNHDPVSAQPVNQLSGEEKSSGWQLLFDGKTLDTWQNTGSDAWVVEDGVIACKGGDNLMTRQPYGNFFFQCEFKIGGSCNSGIFLRAGDYRNPVSTGVEVQIADERGPDWPAKRRMGAIYGFQEPSASALKSNGEWNHILILCLDNQIKIRLNDLLIIDMDVNNWTHAHVNPDGTWNKFKTALKDLPKTGYIGFQNHGKPGSNNNASAGNIWLRNLKILEIPE